MHTTSLRYTLATFFLVFSVVAMENPEPQLTIKKQSPRPFNVLSFMINQFQGHVSTRGPHTSTKPTYTAQQDDKEHYLARDSHQELHIPKSPFLVVEDRGLDANETYLWSSVYAISPETREVTLTDNGLCGQGITKLDSSEKFMHDQPTLESAFKAWMAHQEKEKKQQTH